MRALAAVTLAAVLTGTAPVMAQTLPHSAPIESAAVAAFVDQFFPREMARRQIPGVVFVLVSGGEITRSSRTASQFLPTASDTYRRLPH
jgi:hypothetical protein